MNNKLCRLCGCEIQEVDLCIKYHLRITTICNCYKNIVSVQTHVHEELHGL